MCDALIDRKANISSLIQEAEKYFNDFFWRFPVVLIYLINSYGDI